MGTLEKPSHSHLPEHLRGDIILWYAVDPSMTKRVNIKQILSNPDQKKELMVGVIQFLQNIEGIDTTKEQAEYAYDKVQEKLNNNGKY